MADPIELLTKGRDTKWVKRGVTAYALGALGFKYGKEIKAWWGRRPDYSVTISKRNALYEEIQERLLDMTPAKKRRAMLVAKRRDTDRTERLATMFDSTISQTVVLDGHKIHVHEISDKIAIEDLKDEFGNNDIISNKRLKFRCRNEEARSAVLRFLEGIIAEGNSVEARRFYTASRWSGEWARRYDLEPRNLDSVILAEGQIESLLHDMNKFLTNRAEYERLGIPYHRGYLFYGPPGTGKTSLAQALTTHFGLDLYFLSLSDIQKDVNLFYMLANVEAGSVLLLEDIDVLSAAKVRDDTATNGMSLSGLLNALDGISTPSGIITIMTTNDKSCLDEALIRPGRIDLQVEIGYLDDDQLSRLVRVWAGQSVDLPSVRGLKLTPADVQEVLKRRIPHVDQAIEDLRLMIKERSL